MKKSEEIHNTDKYISIINECIFSSCSSVTPLIFSMAVDATLSDQLNNELMGKALHNFVKYQEGNNEFKIK